MPLHYMGNEKDNGKYKKPRQSYPYQIRERTEGAVRAAEKDAIENRPGFITGDNEVRRKTAKQNEIERQLAREKVMRPEAERFAMPDLWSQPVGDRYCAVVENPAVVKANQKLLKRIQALSLARQAEVRNAITTQT